MAFHSPCVLRCAVDAQYPAQVIRRLRHVGIAVRPRGERGLIIGHRRPSVGKGLHAERAARRALGPASDNDISAACSDQGVRQQDCIHTANALPIYAESRNPRRQSGRQGAKPRWIAASAKRVADDDLVHLGGVQSCVRQTGLYHRGGEVVKGQRGKGTASRHDGGAAGGEDNAHVKPCAKAVIAA